MQLTRSQPRWNAHFGFLGCWTCRVGRDLRNSARVCMPGYKKINSIFLPGWRCKRRFLPFRLLLSGVFFCRYESRELSISLLDDSEVFNLRLCNNVHWLEGKSLNYVQSLLEVLPKSKPKHFKSNIWQLTLKRKFNFEIQLMFAAFEGWLCTTCMLTRVHLLLVFELKLTCTHIQTNSIELVLNKVSALCE